MPRPFLALAALVLIVFASLVLNLHNNRFPNTYHADESKKGAFVLGSPPDFRHPVLLIQLGRAANVVAHRRDTMRVVVLGRRISAVVGAVLVWLSFAAARHTLGVPLALAVAACVATSPLLVGHAHYFKEDLLFAATWMAALIGLGGLLALPTRLNAIGAGLAIGLAASSKYIGAALVPALVLLALVFYFRGRKRAEPGALQRAALARALLLAALFATTLFFIINIPLALNFVNLWDGFRYELSHATAGHGDTPLPLSPLEFGFAFHFQHSLMPQMTPAVAVLALLAVAYLLARWRQLGVRDRVILAATILYYFALESSPLKPFPDYARYMAPIVAPLIYLIFLAARLSRQNRTMQFILAPVLTLAFGFAAVDSIRLVHSFRHDTRQDAIAWSAKLPRRAVLGDLYTGLDNMTPSLATMTIEDLRAQGVEYVAASSFMWDRMLLVRRLRDASPELRETADRYDALLRLPLEHEFTSPYGSYGFNNPTIRIIKIPAVQNY